MLLLITASEDGTSDLICKKLGLNVFRLNYDIFRDYKLEFTPDYWIITNPAGHSISSSNVSSCFWWKAFNFPIANQDNFVVDEVKYIFRELYAWCKLRGIVKGNPFDFHNQLGKINLLHVASDFFAIPETLISFKCAGVESFGDKKLVAKALTSGLTSSMGTLLTTEVEKSKLHPEFPWFLQTKIVSEFDVTVFICGSNIFAYEKSRKNLKGLDWRGEQSLNPNVKEWFTLTLTKKEEESIHSFCNKVGVSWGRIDFMKQKNELIFLEFNANGQWVFLDYSGEDGLLDFVVKYLFPNFMVKR